MSATATKEKGKKPAWRMSGAQQATYRTKLWPAAAAALGCAPGDDERRRAVLKQLTGKESTTELSNLQVTVLFRGLEAIARGGEDVSANLALVQAEEEAANKEAGQRADVRGLILNEGFTDAYIASVAAQHLRREGASEWRKLSTPALWKTLYTLRARRREQKRNDPGADRAPRQIVVPYHQRAQTLRHERYMTALRAAVPSGRLEEITGEAELELVEGIQDSGVLVCDCRTCETRRLGDPPSAVWEKRAESAESVDYTGSDDPQVEAPF